MKKLTTLITILISCLVIFSACEVGTDNNEIELSNYCAQYLSVDDSENITILYGLCIHDGFSYKCDINDAVFIKYVDLNKCN